jgi:ribonuclease P protein component
MFSVSKKKFSRAVDRNRIKRLLRETYRLLKPDLYTSLPAKRHFHLAIIFTGTEIPTLPVIQKNLSSSLERWLKKLDAVRSDPKNERKQEE